ncbi:DUF1194 domain-containing protein [Mesorhizobium sp. M1B.F.Ca.ET.045.04.1.1]|uniref:DUF1194 domain-containing protein n=1 Tax=Mesorhizobium sp. M1B.F.Ca.ET.045.04.1.1 TaxID=2493673 RepID=UPI0032AF6D73
MTYFEWSSAGHARTVLPWTRICGLEDAKAAAAAIRRKGDTGYIRRGRGGTSVSEAIDVGSLLLDRFPGNAMRKVIDISSNGENNDGLPVQPSRQNAIGKGYTINAIAIAPDDEDPKQPLATYFARSVIGGSQAFVISPTGPRDYTAALRRKLVIEVSMNVLYRHPAYARAPGYCRARGSEFQTWFQLAGLIGTPLSPNSAAAASIGSYDGFRPDAPLSSS